jgi:nitrogen regulatory protein PII-like uncharacterized protein
MENLSIISSHILSSVMLLEVNSSDSMKSRVKVTQFEIDEFHPVIPLKELELKVSTDDESIIQILKNSSYAAILLRVVLRRTKVLSSWLTE